MLKAQSIFEQLATDIRALAAFGTDGGVADGGAYLPERHYAHLDRLHALACSEGGNSAPSATGNAYLTQVFDLLDQLYPFTEAARSAARNGTSDPSPLVSHFLELNDTFNTLLMTEYLQHYIALKEDGTLTFNTDFFHDYDDVVEKIDRYLQPIAGLIQTTMDTLHPLGAQQQKIKDTLLETLRNIQEPWVERRKALTQAMTAYAHLRGDAPPPEVLKSESTYKRPEPPASRTRRKRGLIGFFSRIADFFKKLILRLYHFFTRKQFSTEDAEVITDTPTACFRPGNTQILRRQRPDEAQPFFFSMALKIPVQSLRGQEASPALSAELSESRGEPVVVAGGSFYLTAHHLGIPRLTENSYKAKLIYHPTMIDNYFAQLRASSKTPGNLDATPNTTKTQAAPRGR